jgi:hypothetical protein
LSGPVIPPNPTKLHGRNLPDGYITVAEFSRSIGLRGGGIYRELQRYGIRARQYGRYRIITTQQADKYLDATERHGIRRVRKRPTGWITTQQAADVVGCSYSVIWNAANEGNIRAVRRGWTRYHDPDEIEQLRLEYSNYPLPGWTSIRSVVDAEGADPGAAKGWLEHNGYEVREFRSRELKQMLLYALRDALEAWRSYYRATQQPPPEGFLTTEEAADIVTCSPGRFWLLAAEADVEYETRGQARYYAPADVERLRDEWQQAPPEGWLELITVARSEGYRDGTPLKRWIQKEGLELGIYRQPYGLRRMSQYAPVEVVEAWLEHRRSKGARS